MAKTVTFLDNRYEVYILPTARAKMELYCDLSEGEIGWLAFVEKFEDQGFLITDCVLLKQEVHATTTEIDPAALLELWGATPIEAQSKIKLWGHSHVNMGVTASGQDDTQMEYFKDGNPWFIRLITNKKREYNIDIYDYAAGIKVHLDQAELKDYNPQAKELRESIAAEIKEKVSKKEYKPATSSLPAKSSSYSKGYGNYRGYKKTSKKKQDILPMLEDIEVKYIKDFDEVLTDPNYWQDLTELL